MQIDHAVQGGIKQGRWMDESKNDMSFRSKYRRRRRTLSAQKEICLPSDDPNSSQADDNHDDSESDAGLDFRRHEEIGQRSTGLIQSGKEMNKELN
jgi:hypothetical protein